MLRNFTVERALERILSGRPFHLRLDDDVIIITTAAPLESVQLKPRREMIAMEQLTDENGVIQRGIADATFDWWLFGNSGGPSATRARFFRILRQKSDAVAQRCGLSEPQKQRLLLAGRGDISRFFERVERLRKKFSDVKNDNQRRNAFFDEHVLPLEAVLNAGPFDDNSLFSKTIAAGLSAEQAARRSPRALPGYDLLANIGLALRGYHDCFGSFPASVMKGPDGKTTYSWRVELLPMLTHYVGNRPGGEVLWRGPLKPDELRQEYWKLIEGLGYRLGEAWDSAHNSEFQSQFSAYFRHPADPAGSVNSACFVVTGAETAFPPERGTRLDEELDGPGSTLLAVEARRDIPWMKPEDIPFDPRQPFTSLGGFDKAAYLAMTCDGVVHAVAASTPESALRSLITNHAQDAASIPGIPWQGTADLAADSDVGETGALHVVITFDGPPPAAKLLNVPPAAAKIPDESLVVNAKTGGIANVAVYIEKVPVGVTVPAAPQAPPVGMAIAGGRFVPRVAVVRTGQSTVFANKDPVPVNVNITSLRNDSTNRVLNPKGTFDWTYTKPERMPISIRSDLQPWMRAYQVVVDHPWAAVTNENGEITLKGLPAGIHLFKVWHEKAGDLEQKLIVAIMTGETTEAELEYPAERFAK